MNKFKVFYKVVLVLLVLILIFGWFFIQNLKPTYKGELSLNTLSEKVTVVYDEFGVPHIIAENETDAFVAYGYVHAQDRFWQMEVMRRIAAGRLSEIFGADLVRVDKLMSGLGIEEASVETIKSLDKNSPSYILTKAYLEGINQFIENGATPLEFHLLGIKKEKYTLKDIYNVFGYMSFSFAAAHKTDPILNEIQENFGKEYVEELGIPLAHTTLLKNSKKEPLKANFSIAVTDIINDLPSPTFIGSNSWVLGADKTKNGKVIFANDPHINYSQPSVWYQSHIKTPNYEMYGFNLALTPFPLLGHNTKHAYGLTMFVNDDIDFYVEEENPDNHLEYKTSTGYKAYDIIEKRIKIKGEKDTVYQIKKSQHGIVMNGLIDHVKNEKSIAMQWVYTKETNKVLKATYGMSHAKSLHEFRDGVSKIHAPGLNVMYGDSANNIAWFAAGKLYKYREGLSTKTFLNGASGEDEIIKYLNFDDNPQAINPPSGYVYSANNQPDSITGVLYPGYYLPEDRAKRIVELIADKNDFTKEDVAKMLLDVKSTVVVEVIKNALEVLSLNSLSDVEKNAVAILKEWDGNYYKNNVAPTIYNRFVYEFLKSTFKDEMGKGFAVFMDGIPLERKMIAVQMDKDTSVWWDDISTKEITEGKKDIIMKSFKSSIAFLQTQLGKDINMWQWKRVISLEHEHPIGKVGGVLRTFFNVGPFQVDGGDQVINNHIFKLDSTGYYKVKAGPSSRRVVDFSDTENSLGIIPTGQSGNRFSPHYKDLTEKYNNGEFIKMKLNQEDINESENKLIFIPKKDGE